MAEFGEQLKKAREEKGMTQQSLAEQVYVTRQTISRWESGDRFPDIVTLKKLSIVLGVSTDNLLSVADIPQVVDKNSLIEKPILKNMLTALYTAISVIFAIEAFISLISPNLIDELIHGHIYAYFLFFVSFSEAVLFIFSLASMINEKDTPKKSGVVIFLFFLLELCSRLHLLINRTTAGLVRTLISYIPFIIGCAGAYLHFVNKRRIKYSQLFIYIPCIFLIFIELFNLTIIVSRYISWINIVTILTMFLKVMVYITFSYQAFILEKRRKVADSMVKN